MESSESMASNHTATTTPPTSPRKSYCDSLLNESTGYRAPSECCAPVRKVRKITPNTKTN